MQAVRLYIAWKVSKYGVISGPHFAVFSPNTRKYRPEIAPYLDTFYAVLISVKLNSIKGKASFLILLKKENTHLQHTGNGHFLWPFFGNFQKTLAGNHCDCKQITPNHRNTTLIFKISKTYRKETLKWPRRNCVNFPSIKITLKKYTEMTLIVLPTKLHPKSMSKWVDINILTSFRHWFDMLCPLDIT